MISAAMRERLPKPPPIQPFTGAAPDVVGVGGASAKIRGYIDAPLEHNGVVVYHPLLVVKGLAFSVLDGTDILRPHDAILILSESSPQRLRSSTCEVCAEQRTDLFSEIRDA